jgi:iron complex outermembrane receptor protein
MPLIHHLSLNSLARSSTSVPALLLAGYLQVAPSSALAQAGAPEGASHFEEVLVNGRRIQNYSAIDALTGTKSNALLKDLPLSVSVVPAELIEDRAIGQLSEALDNVAGAQRKQGYGGVQNFGAYLRGFDSSFLTLRNGIRDFGFYTLRDTANAERFEVLKGPASVLYGAVYPGGITNTITKKPVFQPLARAIVTAGSHDRFRAEADLGGPVADNVFYRLNLAAEHANSFRDHVGSKNYFVAPVATWLIGEQTILTAEVEYKHSDYTWDLGLPRHPVAFQLPINRFIGEPDGINKADSVFSTTRLEHEFSPSWKVRQILGYAFTDGDYKLRSPTGVAANGRTVNRVAYDTWEKSHTYVAQHEVAGDLSFWDTRHQLVAGVENYETQQSYSFLFSSLAPIDAFNPTYGAQPGPGGFVLFADQNDSRAVGLYAQDLVSIGEQWKLLLGGRYDSVKNATVNLLTRIKTSRKRDSAFSPQAGLVYQPDAATSLYVSYGESFLSVTSGRTASGADLKPESGRQVEIGIKRQWLDGALITSLALFDITRFNVSTPDPVTPAFRIQTAEQASQGAEVEVHGAPLTGWDVSLALSYIDAKVTRDNSFRVGSRLPGAPKYIASFWNKYSFGEGSLAGLELGGGIYYTARRAVALPNPAFDLPAYVRLDAMISYPFDRWKFQLNIKNLADETIYDLTSSSIMPQEPRSVTFRAAYAW